MIVAGAGGHALELLDILISREMTEDLFFFDNINSIKIFNEKYPILNSEDQVISHFKRDSRFILGTGNPEYRYKLYKFMESLGGVCFPIFGEGSIISKFSIIDQVDILNFCFVGSNTKIGIGTLINTGAQVHHEVEIGNFSEVNPGAVILGKVQIGNFTSIGANATVLPNVKVGNNVIVGAGSVVTNDIPDGVIVKGVPGKY
ncbi:acetyltransferase [Shivajiella indica]|uniref:Acetyltransferase n=1 Tax=Shivajiella indica TaxID=872115 RepID=A0ABW5BB64_9BACT